MGADGYDGTPDYVVDGADLTAFNNVYWTNHYDPADTSEKVQSFVKAYQDKFGSTPNAISALAYDAVYMHRWKAGVPASRTTLWLGPIERFFGISGKRISAAPPIITTIPVKNGGMRLDTT